MISCTAVDRRWYQENVLSFLHENTYCGYSSEVPGWAASNEYLQHVFFVEKKENINNFQLKQSTLSGSLYHA